MTVTAVPRRPWRHTLAQVYYRLRTEGDTPGRKAGAVFIGVLVGCSPLYGLHLPLCVALAWLAGVNRVTAYLMAYVNNPLTAPIILALEFAAGHWLTGGGEWLGGGKHDAVGLAWEVGGELLLGGLVVGATLGAVLALAAYVLSRRARLEENVRQLIETTADRYLDTGISHWEFARSKLRHDPLYLGLLQSGLLPPQGRLLDLGCGRGLLPALLRTAVALHRERIWPAQWPAPPDGLILTGVEQRTQDLAAARAALAGEIELQAADLDAYAPPPCKAALLLDVLHYLPPPSQEALIARVSGSLTRGGILLIREPDAGAGLSFTLTRLAERICALARGQLRIRHSYRRLDDWLRLLRDQGLTVTVRPMSQGTPYANVLIAAHKPAIDPQLATGDPLDAGL